MPKVGIFFYVRGEVIADAVLLEDGEPYGDTIGFGGHFDCWDALVPCADAQRLLKAHPYDYFPRGRVVFFSREGEYRLYSDQCLSKEDINKIAASFDLQRFKVAHDEHYRCSQCNPDYLDI